MVAESLRVVRELDLSSGRCRSGGGQRPCFKKRLLEKAADVRETVFMARSSCSLSAQSSSTPSSPALKPSTALKTASL